MAKLKIEAHCPYLIEEKKVGGEIEENNGRTKCEVGETTVQTGTMSTWMMNCPGCRFYSVGFTVRTPKN